MLVLIAVVCTAILAVDKDINTCLYDFYLSTDGPNWYSSDGWDALVDENGEHCLAYGIECDINGDIVSISMPMNNLMGEIPACFATLQTLKELTIQSNYVTGSMKNLPPNLVKISLSMTSFTNITSDICRLTSLDTFSMSYCELTNVTLPTCLYNIPSISIMNSGIRLPEELASLTIDTGRRGLSIPGVDASKLTFTIPADEMRELGTLDLSGTGVSGSFNLSQLIFAFPRVQDLYLGGNNFVGWIDFDTFLQPISVSVLRTSTINLGSNGFKGILNGITEISALVESFRSDLYGIDLSNNSLIGISPTLEELQLLLLKHKDFYLLNLENNTFLCTDERPSLFDCIDLQVVNFTTHEGTADDNSAMSSSKQLQLDMLLPGNVPEDLATEFVSHLGLSFESPEESSASEMLSLTLLSTTYSETQDSTLFSTLLSASVDDHTGVVTSFKLMWTSMNLTLKLQLPHDSVVEEQQSTDFSDQPSSFPSSIDNEGITGDSMPKVTLDVYGMSRCPYFSQLVVSDIQYLISAYPMATKILTLRYMPLSKPSIYTVSGGYSSHGAAEVTGDYYFLCLQNYTNLNATVMRDYYLCMYGAKASVSGVPYNVTRCNMKVLRQQYNFTDDDVKNIMSCSHSRANELLNQTFSYVLTNRVGFSPTLYLENELLCLSGIKCLYDDSSAHLETRVANLVETVCSIYQGKYGEYPNCTQKLATTAQCPADEIIVGSTCVMQKSIVIAVSACCIAFLLCLVVSLMIYSSIKERRAKSQSQRGAHRDKIDALLTDNDESASDPELI